MNYTKKAIKKYCEKNDYFFCDYYIDNMHMENKYYIKSWKTGKIRGFDRLEAIYYYIGEEKQWEEKIRG